MSLFVIKLSNYGKGKIHTQISIFDGDKTTSIVLDILGCEGVADFLHNTGTYIGKEEADRDYKEHLKKNNDDDDGGEEIEI